MTGTISSSMLPAVLVYDSIKQLYYGNYISGSGGFIGEADTSNVLLGAIADNSGYRKFFFISSTWICVLFTFLL